MFTPATTVTTDDQFWNWVNNADLGDSCEYYRGLSVTSKETNEDGTMRKIRPPIANAAWLAYTQGLVVLVQRRTGDEDAPFAWLAQRRRPGAEPPPMPHPIGRDLSAMPDWSTKDGATKLAQTIMDFWHKRGYPQVFAWAEAVPGRSKHWTTRHNLIGGLPPVVTRVAAE